MGRPIKKSRSGRLTPLRLAFLLATITIATPVDAGNKPDWLPVAPGVLRSAGYPCAYALVEEGKALVIGAPRGADLAALATHGGRQVELALVTHHHRDTSAQARRWIDKGVPVRAPREGLPWLSVEGVREFWLLALPRPTPGREPPLKERTFNEWVYLVHANGIADLACDLEDGQELAWRSWRLTAIGAPGHSRDHMAFLATRTSEDIGSRILFCGDALCAPGKLWSVYTTDWDHWTDKGLQAAASSLEKLAALDPDAICPEHGPPILEGAADALRQTAAAASAAGALKSFERYTKEQIGRAPQYDFLAPAQVATAGDEPWSQISSHLYLTGNTYALASRDGPLLLVDPYGPRIAEQVATLRDQRKLGPLERVLISHAHNDHYKGLWLLPDRDRFQVWTLSRVARPIGAPYDYCAPYLDARSVKVQRRFADAETVRWREYELKVTHFPGQTEFTMGVQTAIDGRRCFFTADNFFHQDQFSGSGGWSGRNRSWPLPYAASARQVLQAAPDWVLAEHGGPFEFNREDFQRRIDWAEAAARAADALSPSGLHRQDWDPQRVRVAPLLHAARPGGRLTLEIVADNQTTTAEALTCAVEAGELTAAGQIELRAPPGGAGRETLTLDVAPTAPPGRHVVPLVITQGQWEVAADTFFVLDVE